MMVDDVKPRFGGIPFRALADGDLTVLDLRVLAAIAAHDGFNKNRRGCFASHKRLAALIGAHYKSAARSIAKLIERGYLDAQQQGEDGRLRVYRVSYTQEDHDAFRGDGRSYAPTKPLRSVTSAVTDRRKESVTHSVTDPPATDREPLAEDMELKSARSVTGAGEIGNRNSPGSEPNALKRGEKTNRIYSTESKGIKNRIDSVETSPARFAPVEVVDEGIDRAEAHLSEGEHEAGSTPSPGALALQVVHRAAHYKQRQAVLIGPATDSDAEIDRTITRTRGDEPVDLEQVRRELTNARPSQALLDNPLCRAARGR